MHKYYMYISIYIKQKNKRSANWKCARLCTTTRFSIQHLKISSEIRIGQNERKPFHFDDDTDIGTDFARLLNRRLIKLFRTSIQPSKNPSVASSMPVTARYERLLCLPIVQFISSIKEGFREAERNELPSFEFWTVIRRVSSLSFRVTFIGVCGIEIFYSVVFRFCHILLIN